MGEISITEDMVNDIFNGNHIVAFKNVLSRFTKMPTAGWYAKKLENGTWHFKWNTGLKFPIPEKYWDALAKDGWELAYPKKSSYQV